MRESKSLIACVIMIGAAILVVPSSAGAATDGWEFDLSVYMFGVGIDGDVTAKGVETEVDLSSSDVFDALELGGMAMLQARNGDWAIHGDVIFLGLGATEDFRRSFGPVTAEVTGEVDVDMTILELDGGYYFSDRFELLFGVRYVKIDGTTEIRTVNFGDFKGEGDESWVDPLVGGRIILPIGKRWSFYGRGDVGGFGVGSDLSWSATVAFSVKATEHVSFQFGYRALDIDYEDGRGQRRVRLRRHVGGVRASPSPSISDERGAWRVSAPAPEGLRRSALPRKDQRGHRGQASSGGFTMGSTSAPGV